MSEPRATYSILLISCPSPNELNAAVWASGHAQTKPPNFFNSGGLGLNSEEVHIACQGCGAVVATYHVHTCARVNLSTAIKNHNQSAARKVKQHAAVCTAATTVSALMFPGQAAAISMAATAREPTSRKRTADHLQQVVEVPLIESMPYSEGNEPDSVSESRRVRQRTEAAQQPSTAATNVSAVVSDQQPANMLVPSAAAASVSTGSQLHPLQPSSTMSAVAPNFGNQHLLSQLTHAEHVPVELPCLMEMSFHHRQFGPHQVWAMLYWVDAEAATHLPFTNGQLPDQYIFTNPGKTRADQRCLYLHQIVHVTPLGSPFGCHVNKWFSSLSVSAQLFHHQTSSLQSWHLMYQKLLTLERVISTTGFYNPDVHRSIRAFENDASSPKFAEFIKKKELLSNRVGYHDEPLLSLDLIRNAIPAGTRDNADEEEDPDCWEDAAAAEEYKMQRYHLPGWVPKNEFLRSRYQRVACEGKLSDVSYRDCLAAMCESECNDLHCDVPSDVAESSFSRLQSPKYVCPHGIKHDPYHGVELVHHDDGQTGMAECMFMTPKHFSTGARNSNNKKKPAMTPPRSAFERKIVFGQISSSVQVDEVRRYAPQLISLVARCLYLAQSKALHAMMCTITTARVVANVADLDCLLRSFVPHAPMADLSLILGPQMLIPLVWKLTSSINGSAASTMPSDASMELKMTSTMFCILRQRCPELKLLSWTPLLLKEIERYGNAAVNAGNQQ